MYSYYTCIIHILFEYNFEKCAHCVLNCTSRTTLKLALQSLKTLTFTQTICNLFNLGHIVAVMQLYCMENL